MVKFSVFLSDRFLCQNFMKLGRREISQIVCCLPEKNKI